MTLTAGARVLRARMGGLTTAARGRVNTAPARAAFLNRFDREVDAEGTLSPAERARRSEAARRLYFTRLAFASSKAHARSTKKTSPVIGSPGEVVAEVQGHAAPTS